MENNIKPILSKYNFRFKKEYGQNFLTDNLLLDDITVKAGVNKDTTVLEIGCGAGTLTSALANMAKRVYGYEIDYKLKPILNDRLSCFNNVELTFCDIMKEDLSAVERRLGEEYVLVANLPYYITTPIIMNFLENSKSLKSMTIMVQKEVALRLVAKEGSSDYGAITVAINLRGSANIVLDVPREKFTPMPNVDSAVVRIDIERDKYKGVDFESVRDLVRCAFSSRRKTLVNNMSNYYKMSKGKATDLLTECGIDTSIRGERLSALEFIKLSEEIKYAK